MLAASMLARTLPTLESRPYQLAAAAACEVLPAVLGVRMKLSRRPSKPGRSSFFSRFSFRRSTLSAVRAFRFSVRLDSAKTPT